MGDGEPGGGGVAGPDERPPLRPVARSGWSGLLERATAPSEPAPGTGVLRSFTGVLGAWRPSVEGLPLRLSFLSLPWLVRERHTADRTAGRTAAGAPQADPTSWGDPTPEATTVSRLLRWGTDAPVTPSSDHGGSTTGPSDDPTVGSSPRTEGRLRDVLRWRPVLVDRPTPTERLRDDPLGNDGAASREPPSVPRRFRTATDTERADAPRPTRTTARTDGRAGSDGPDTTTDRADDGGARETPARIRSAWPASPRTSVGPRRPTDGFRPTLPAAGVPTLLHLSRHRAPDGDHPGHRRSGPPATAPPDGSRAPDGGLAPADGTVRPALTLPGGAAGSPPSTEPLASAGAERGRPLIYRHTASPNAAAPGASARRQDDGPATGLSSSDGRRPTPPETVPPVDTPATGRSRPADRSVPAARSHGAGDADTPTSPFASFADSEAVVDHLYREFERRWRIERERRGR